MTNDLEPAASGRPSRRVVLAGLASGLGVVLIGPATQATAAGSTIHVTPLKGRSWLTTSGTSLVPVPTLLGARLDVVAEAVRAGSTITVSFDDRI